jgi:hypothetical protein
VIGEFGTFDFVAKGSPIELNVVVSEIISSVFKELSTDPILDFGEFV